MNLAGKEKFLMNLAKGPYSILLSVSDFQLTFRSR